MKYIKVHILTNHHSKAKLTKKYKRNRNKKEKSMISYMITLFKIIKKSISLKKCGKGWIEQCWNLARLLPLTVAFPKFIECQLFNILLLKFAHQTFCISCIWVYITACSIVIQVLKKSARTQVIWIVQTLLNEHWINSIWKSKHFFTAMMTIFGYTKIW